MRTDRLLHDFDLQPRWIQFPLHPETPPEGRRIDDVLAAYGTTGDEFEVRMAGLMTAEGLPYRRRTHTYNSRLAQELAIWAEPQERGGRIHDVLFRAFFADGIDISRMELLLGLVESLHLDADDARDALVTRRFRREVDAHWARARFLGVTSVPTWIIGDRGVVGAQPYEALEEFVVTAGAWRRGSTTATAADSDSDADAE